MRLLLMTNIPSHHLVAYGTELYKRLGEDFTLVFMEPVNADRAAIGWSGCGEGLSWVIRAWESPEAYARMLRCVEEYDAVVFGSVDTEIVRVRIDCGKLTFKYSERLWKNPLHRILDPRIKPRAKRSIYSSITSIDKPNCHLLAAGAYAVYDFARMGAFQGRAWRFGYFPELSDSPPRKMNDPLHLLWAGRMDYLKRVDLIVKAAVILGNAGFHFRIDLVGDGSERLHLERLCHRYHLGDMVHFHPFTDTLGVRRFMENADVYIFPSDFNEGWGAVLNEAMGAGCCPVASVGVGAAPWLIQHGDTGLLFESGSVKSLTGALVTLLENPDKCMQIRYRAWDYIHTTWSPAAAAERLISLCKGLLGLDAMPEYIDGPCASAPCVKKYKIG